MTSPRAAEVRRVGRALADALSEQTGGLLRDQAGSSPFQVLDTHHHLQFLLSALELDEPSVFSDYALCCRDRSGLHGADLDQLAGAFETLCDAVTDAVSPPTASEVRRVVRGGIDALSTPRPSSSLTHPDWARLCHLYVAAAVTGRREQALAIVREAVAGVASPVDVYVELFQSALYEIGRRWQTSGLTIAEEQMATATTQFILGVLQDELVVADGGRQGFAVVTGVVGDHHVVGTSIVANILEEDGWDVRLLGTDLPPEEVVSVLHHRTTDLLAVSVTLTSSVTHVRDLIAAVRREVANPPRVIVGGAPFREDPSLWRDVGADGFAADARGVVEVAHSVTR